MGKKSHIDVKVSVESIRDSLRKRIVSEHSVLITDVIMGNLDLTEIGLEQLFKAMSGIKDKLKFKVADKVLSLKDPLYTWEMNEVEMEANGMLIQGRVPAQITEVNEYAKKPYGITYRTCKSNITKEHSTWVEERHLCTEEEWPEDMEPDLPF